MDIVFIGEVNILEEGYEYNIKSGPFEITRIVNEPEADFIVENLPGVKLVGLHQTMLIQQMIKDLAMEFCKEYKYSDTAKHLGHSLNLMLFDSLLNEYVY